MGIAFLTCFPAGHHPCDARARDFDLTEVEAAIELIRLGFATRVRLANLRHARSVAKVALARARAAGVHVSIDDASGPPVLTVSAVD